jgi:hypothetical protein
MTSLDMYQLIGLNVSGWTIRFPDLGDGVHLDEIYFGYFMGSASISVPSFPDDFSGRSQDMSEDWLLMARASSCICWGTPSSATVPRLCL